MQIKKPYLLLLIAGLLMVIVLYFVFRLLSNSSTTPVFPESTPTPTPSTTNTSKEPEVGIKGHGQELPFPSPNPTYIELLKTQPFWDLFPHRSDTYLIEHIMHNDTIQITTIIPAVESPERERLVERYREEARNWLVKNGAKLNELDIIYKP